jgi:hypothetical protein
MTNPNLFPAAPGVPDGWSYTGCRNESKVDGRALKSHAFSSDAMTVEICVTECSSLGYSIVSGGYPARWFVANADVCTHTCRLALWVDHHLTMTEDPLTRC